MPSKVVSTIIKLAVVSLVIGMVVSFFNVSPRQIH